MISWRLGCLVIGVIIAHRISAQGIQLEEREESNGRTSTNMHTGATAFSHNCPWTGRLSDFKNTQCVWELTGTLRYVRDINEVQLCDGESWLTMYSFVVGSISRPGNSCQHLYSQGVRESGPYWIYPNPDIKHPIQVYCEMEFNGGGWLRVYNMMARPGNNDNAAEFYQSIIRNDDVRAVPPDSTSSSIYTRGLKLENYKEVPNKLAHIFRYYI
uniref:Uncharacterized protein LOC100368506 n=1 Tax=Saccoglossus kowalevskii TaxID=10224 RepID=A0ABM0LU54_SACKO|nr:PREDICTED: uncharacterized protein LOC100368506 [Saccoglossus kowalevskii]